MGPAESDPSGPPPAGPEESQSEQSRDDQGPLPLTGAAGLGAILLGSAALFLLGLGLRTLRRRPAPEADQGAQED